MIDIDLVKQEVSLCASRDKVWEAISNPENFGLWFGVAWQPGTAFVVDAAVTGRVAPTNVHPGTARKQKPYFGLPVAFTIDQIEAPRSFAFRWNPFAWEVSGGLADEPTTLVVFELHEAGDRTNLTITESGFDRLPLERRDIARATSTKGWARQLFLIELFLAGARDLRAIQD